MVVNALQSELERKNIELITENERLLRNANAMNRTLELERSDENRRLVF